MTKLAPVGHRANRFCQIKSEIKHNWDQIKRQQHTLCQAASTATITSTVPSCILHRRQSDLKQNRDQIKRQQHTLCQAASTVNIATSHCSLLAFNPWHNIYVQPWACNYTIGTSYFDNNSELLWSSALTSSGCDPHH
jgi:hypothetical protein